MWQAGLSAPAQPKSGARSRPEPYRTPAEMRSSCTPGVPPTFPSLPSLGLPTHCPQAYLREGLAPPEDLKPPGLQLERGDNFYDADVSHGAWRNSMWQAQIKVLDIPLTQLLPS